MKYTETAEWLKQQIATAGKEIPTVAVVLGSGLGRLAQRIATPLTIPYSQIPHFKTSTAVGHKGNLIIGTLGGKTVAAMQGRFHYYEGYTMEEVTLPIRVLATLGVKTVMVSNAAGAINPHFKVGDLMVIEDHISFMPNPLIGPNNEEFGPRFPDMTQAYSLRLRQVAKNAAETLGVTLRQGIYVAETGPTYETPAEYRMYRLLGGDAVGMSTVPEVIVARHCGLEVFGISVITNQANDLGTLTEDGQIVVNDGNDVVRAANSAADTMSTLFETIIAKL